MTKSLKRGQCYGKAILNCPARTLKISNILVQDEQYHNPNFNHFSNLVNEEFVISLQ